MKHFLLYLLFILIPFALLAQEKDCPTCPDNNVEHSEYDVIKTRDIMYEGEFVPGQILLKLKDDVGVSLAKVNGVAIMGVTPIDVVLQKHNIQKAENLFPNVKRSFNKRMLKTSNGKEFEQPNLFNIFKIVGDSNLNVFEVINELKELPDVEYAEPNYIFSIVDSKPVSPPLNENEMIEWIKEHPEINVTNSSALLMTNDQLQKPNVLTPNDPLYQQQWGIPATQVDVVWDSTTGDTTQLIAILDTGVDWLHPDLKNKIWTNPNEIPDNGVDDDGNGYVDDVRGWDWINNDNNPTDDNSHGTHVAGIAAAEANNGIGIAGVNWKSKIMPLKVFQSSGRGDVVTITKGINYATQQGATVINMSFGSYVRSLTMENVLANAYSTSVLVAAAGNDERCIGPGLLCRDFHPAALTYVLGVEATTQNGVLAGFSNFDQDGPVLSRFSELFNYEIRAPGILVLSTIPDGRYRVYDGTSMAAPLVSGGVSLYQSLRKHDSQEYLWGNLINTSNNCIQIKSAMEIQAKPKLNIVDYHLVDTLDGPGNGLVDAGETIELWITVKNTWKQADSVFCAILFGEFEDTTSTTIIKPTSFIGSISAYATRTNQMTPFMLHVNPSIEHNRDIVFKIVIWDNESVDTVKSEIILNVNKGQYLSGVMDSTLILTPDKLWLVNQSFRIGENGTLIVKAGTRVELSNVIVNRGSLFAYGTADSLVVFKGRGFRGTGNFSFYHTYFTENSDGFGDQTTYSLPVPFVFDHCIFENILYPTTYVGSFFTGSNNTFYDCTFRNCYFAMFNFAANPVVERCIFDNCYTYVDGFLMYMNSFPGSYNIYNKIFSYIPQGDPTSLLFPGGNITSKGNNFLSYGQNSFAMVAVGSSDIINIPDQYWGTTSLAKIQSKIYDFWDNPNLPQLNFVPFRTIPSDSAHGFVWKVLINDKDAQDDILDPIGVGKQKFDVYFNRSMDTSYTPQLTFGVREPFTQQAVIDSGLWSENNRVWTAYNKIKLYTGDGINTIRVSSARDLENYEIPVEDMRFKFLISAAGSSSLDFAATAGLGKVNLEWSNPQDVPDLLGYNLYRLEHINDSTLTQPTMINTSLINDTLFTDFNVIPNKKYYYYYRTVRTDFSESDSSRVVSTTPYTATLGDGNGDLSVNVLDVLSIVAYILGQNPQPFIFDAADVVRDSIINVLDVVGNVNIILKGTLLKNYLAKTSFGNAKIEFTGNEVYLTTDQPVAGIQLQFKGKGLKDKKFIYSGSTPFENMSSSFDDTAQIALMYSLNKNEFAPGKYLIGRIEGDAKEISLSDAVLSDNEGNKINLNLIDNGVSTIPEIYYLDQNYPNPFNLSTTIQYGVPAKTAGKIVIYNILGQQVRTFDLGEREAGRYKLIWDGKNNYGSIISSGVYIFRFESVNFTSAKKMMLLK